MSDAELHFDGALAELRRAEGLFRGPLTQAKKSLLEDRLLAARSALAKAYFALAAQRCDPDPLPSGDLAPNVLVFEPTRRLTRRPF